MKSLTASFLAAAAALVVVPAVHAQNWPTQTVRVVVPFEAGGPTDATARLVADELGRQLKNPVIVENRSGAGSSLGTAAVLNAPADGHTILYTTPSLIYMKWMVPKLSINPEKDLVPIAVIGSTAYILAVNNDFPARTLPEVVTLVRNNPNKFNYASAGIGSAMHFMFEHFLSTGGGLKVTHVPYKGGGGTTMALISGQVQLLTDPASNTLPYIAKGSLRPIAVTSRERLPNLPDVPTFAESGLPEFLNFDAGGWYMVLVSSGTPAPLIAKINEAFTKVLSAQNVSKRLAELNLQVPKDNTPAANAALLKREFQVWGEVAQKSNIKPQ